MQTSVAIVTGAGSGLGLATARRVVEAGGRVGLVDRDAELIAKVKAELGDCALALPADVTSAPEVAVERLLGAFGAVHVCVSCAGIAPAAKVVSRGRPAPLDGFERTVAINLVGTFNVTRIAAAAMVRNESMTAASVASS